MNKLCEIQNQKPLFPLTWNWSLRTDWVLVWNIYSTKI